MRIVVDIDGTLCPIKTPEESYAELGPHYIILLTSRNMASCQGNVGKVMRNVGKITLDWLEKHDIEYDEIYFGKPNAEIYIDDRAIRFSSWQEITDECPAQEARAR